MKLIIGWSTPKKQTLFSNSIRSTLNTPYSHVYIRIYDTYLDRWIVYQSSGLVVNLISWNKFQTIENVIEEAVIEIDEKTVIKILQSAIDKLGTSYGIKKVFGLWIAMTLKRWGYPIKNPFYDNGATDFCSELAVVVLAEAGIKLPKEDDLISPKDLNQYLKQLPIVSWITY